MVGSVYTAFDFTRSVIDVIRCAPLSIGKDRGGCSNRVAYCQNNDVTADRVTGNVILCSFKAVDYTCGILHFSESVQHHLRAQRLQ